MTSHTTPWEKRLPIGENTYARAIPPTNNNSGLQSTVTFK